LVESKIQKVAVIVPCFNCEKYIRRTIDSVLIQDYKAIEILAIDDGSTDKTKAILESYSPFIRILSHLNNANLGQAASINLGISETNAELIAFIDSDDIWYQGKIKKQVSVFDQHKDIGLVYTNGYAIDENDNRLYTLFNSEFQEKNVVGSILLDCYITSPTNVMIKADLCRAAGLFNVNLQSMDHDMFIRLSEVSRFFYISDCLVGYRRHQGQQSLKRRQWEDGFIILSDACNRYPYPLKLRFKRLAVLYYRLGEYDWRQRQYFKGLINLFLAGLTDPIRAYNFVVDFFIKKLKLLKKGR
jgi:glycosyltransferase involved in cell wall biosynthesis